MNGQSGFFDAIGQPLRRDHLLDYVGLVINHEMRVALDHRKRFVPEHVGDFEERTTLRGEIPRRRVP